MIQILLKSVHFKNTVARSSVLSKSFSVYYISWNQNKVNWCIIENYHNFERTEGCTTVFLKWTDFNDGFKRASPWSWEAQLSNLISNLISSSSYQTIQTEKKVMRMATLLSSPFEQWHFTSQTGHQSQTFWAQVGRYYNKMWEKTQRSLWLAPKRDDLIDFYECHTKGHNELARLSSDGGSAFLCSKLQIHFILQIKRLSQKRVKSESKTTNSSRRFLVMGCI